MLSASARRLQAHHGGAPRAPAPPRRLDLRALKAQHIEAARERIFGPQGSMPGDRQFRKPLEGRRLMRWYFPSKFNLQDFRIDEYYEMQAERFGPREDHRFVASLEQTLKEVMANRERLYEFFQAVSEETFLANPTLQDLYGLFRLCDPRLALGFQPPEQVFKEHSPLFSRSPLFTSSSREDDWHSQARQSVMEKLSPREAVKFDRQLEKATSKAKLEDMLSEKMLDKRITPPMPIGPRTIRYWEKEEGGVHALEADPVERDLGKRVQAYVVEDLAALCKTFRTRSIKKLEEFIQGQVRAWERRRPDLHTAAEFPAAFKERLRQKDIRATERFLKQQVAMWESRWEERAAGAAAARSPGEARRLLGEVLEVRRALPETTKKMGFEATFDEGVFKQALSSEFLEEALKCFEGGVHLPEPLRPETGPGVLVERAHGILSRQAELWLEKGVEQCTAEEVREAERVREVILRWAEKHDLNPYFVLALDTDDVCWAHRGQGSWEELQQKVKDCASPGSLAEAVGLRRSLLQEAAKLKKELEAELERNRVKQAKEEEEAAELERKRADETAELNIQLDEHTKEELEAELEAELKSDLDKLREEAAELDRKLGALQSINFDRGVFKQALSSESLDAVWDFIHKVEEMKKTDVPESPEDAPGAFSLVDIWVRQVVLWCHRGMQPHTATDIKQAAKAWLSLGQVRAKLERELADENDTQRWDDAVHEAEQAEADAAHLPLSGAPMVQKRVVQIDLSQERRKAEEDFETLQNEGPKHLQSYVARRHRFVDPMFRRRRLKWLEREAAGQNKKRETEYNMYYAKHPDDHTEWPTNKASVTVVWPSPYH